MREKNTCFSYGNYTPEMLLAFLIERLFSCCFWPKAYAQSDWYGRHCLKDNLKIDLIRNNSEWLGMEKEKQSPLWQWTNENICSRILIWEYLNLKYAFHLLHINEFSKVGILNESNYLHKVMLKKKFFFPKEWIP